VSYTLAKWALWLVGAAAIGGIVGWLLRGLGRHAGAADANEESAAPMADELESLHARAAQLEPLTRERDKLRIQLDDCIATSAARTDAAVMAAARLADAPSAPENPAELERLTALLGQQDATIGDLRARLWNHEAKLAELQSIVARHSAATAPPEPDLEEGGLVLGERVRFNDLTVVEGIGPKIAAVLQAEGIRTWWQLHTTDVALLAEILAVAGPRFQVHNPASWPQQAGMLARGEWRPFLALIEGLRGGRASE